MSYRWDNMDVVAKWKFKDSNRIAVNGGLEHSSYKETHMEALIV